MAVSFTDPGGLMPEWKSGDGRAQGKGASQERRLMREPVI